MRIQSCLLSFIAVVGISAPVAAAPPSILSATTMVVDRGPSCANGYVWREARFDDYACVAPEARAQAWAENGDAPRRWMNGAYGPHTCIAGYVWREAYPGDDVCVSPDRRNAVRSENAAASGHVAIAAPIVPIPIPLPTPAPGTITPPVILPLPMAAARCDQGYVWREAGPNDYVCVAPESRTRVRMENDVAASRWTSGGYGARTCVSGFVWREAFAGDQVCVTPEVRAMVREENGAADYRRR